MPASFYVICREATVCRDFDRWRVVRVEGGKVVGDDFGYPTLKHAVKVYRKRGLPIFTPEGPVPPRARPDQSRSRLVSAPS
jgi:hypothetical protein